MFFTAGRDALAPIFRPGALAKDFADAVARGPHGEGPHTYEPLRQLLLPVDACPQPAALSPTLAKEFAAAQLLFHQQMDRYAGTVGATAPSTLGSANARKAQRERVSSMARIKNKLEVFKDLRDEAKKFRADTAALPDNGKHRHVHRSGPFIEEKNRDIETLNVLFAACGGPDLLTTTLKVQVVLKSDNKVVVADCPVKVTRDGAGGKTEETASSPRLGDWTMSKQHTVQPGDTLFKLAHQYGFPSWQAIWNHADNGALKEKRKDAHTLAPGDVVVIPDKEPKEWKCRTDEKHVFRLRSKPPVLIKIVLTDDAGKPEGGKKFKAEVEGLPPTEGTTKDDGSLEFEAKPDSDEAKLTVWLADGEKEFVVEIGHLDPITETSGVQARLANLGFACEVSGTLDETTRQAIRDLQETLGRAPTGELDNDLRNELAKMHGR